MALDDVRTHAVAVLLSAIKTARVTAPWAKVQVGQLQKSVDDVLSSRPPSDATLMAQHISHGAAVTARDVRTRLMPHERQLCGLIGLLSSLMWMMHRRSREEVRQLKNSCASARMCASLGATVQDVGVTHEAAREPEVESGLRSELDASMSNLHKMMVNLIHAEAVAARAIAEAEVTRAAERQLAERLKQAEDRIADLLAGAVDQRAPKRRAT